MGLRPSQSESLNQKKVKKTLVWGGTTFRRGKKRERKNNQAGEGGDGLKVPYKTSWSQQNVHDNRYC